MEHPSEVGPVNLGNPVEVTVLELAQEIVRLTGSASRIAFRPLPEVIRCAAPGDRSGAAGAGVRAAGAAPEGLYATIQSFRRALAGLDECARRGSRQWQLTDCRPAIALSKGRSGRLEAHDCRVCAPRPRRLRCGVLR